jgi:hypothetical protein
VVGRRGALAKPLPRGILGRPSSARGAILRIGRVLPNPQHAADRPEWARALGLIQTGSAMESPRGRSVFVIGLACGAIIWVLSPLITGQAEPWDAAGAYYPGALFIAGLLASLALPGNAGRVALGIFAGQGLVLIGRVIADPSSGGLWPLGILFLGLYSVLALIGAVVGSALGVRRQRQDGSPGG